MIALEMSTFFGRLHPLMVHLPIGFLILALLIGALRFEDNKSLNRITGIVWGLSFLSAAFSALMGWLLAKNGHYIEADLIKHQWSGVILVVLSGLGWVFQLRNFNFPKILRQINHVFILIFLFVVGHLGGKLTHGKNYLYEYAPDPIKNVLVSKKEPLGFKDVALDSIRVFEDLIHPLFTSKCVACHNNTIARGGLNMTTTTGLFDGGNSGPAISPKNLNKSLVFRRIISPQSNDKFMPPSGIPMTYEEIRLIEWWIKAGAPLNKSFSEIEIKEEIQTILLKNYTLDTRVKPWYERVELTPLSKEDFQLLEQHNFSYRTLSVENSLLDLRYQGAQMKENDLAIIDRYAPYITWLNLSDCQLQADQLQVLSKMENLTRLSLHKNPLKSAALIPIKELKHLEILTLHSTQVDQGIFDLLQSLKNLKKVYLWNTRLSTKDIDRLAVQFEDIEIIGGLK